jgi:tRNA nucleotidyltransferase/poly(A) polymerase
MHLKELLNSLSRLAKENNVSEPYVVGGLPRDKAFGVPMKIKDVDITTGDAGSFALAMLASKEWPEAHFRSYDDGHSSLDFKNIRLDFSNNFKLPGVKKELEDRHTDKKQEVAGLKEELYSRDFTINTLLQPMDLSKEPLDLTSMALDDIKNKILRTPVNPALTIGYDPRRILRAIKLTIKFDLHIQPDLAEALVKYRGGIRDISLNHIKKQVNQMLKIDAKKTIQMLSEYKLLPIIPLSRLMTLEMAKNRMIQHLLDGGGGF